MIQVMYGFRGKSVGKRASRKLDVGLGYVHSIPNVSRAFSTPVSRCPGVCHLKAHSVTGLGANSIRVR